MPSKVAKLKLKKVKSKSAKTKTEPIKKDPEDVNFKKMKPIELNELLVSLIQEDCALPRLDVVEGWDGLRQIHNHYIRNRQ